MSKNTRIMRLNKDLHQLLFRRSQNFKSTITKESENLVRISEELSRKLGIDITRVPVLESKKVKLTSKKNLMVFGK